MQPEYQKQQKKEKKNLYVVKISKALQIINHHIVISLKPKNLLISNNFQSTVTQLHFNKIL